MKQSLFTQSFEVEGKERTIKGSILVNMNPNYSNQKFSLAERKYLEKNDHLIEATINGEIYISEKKSRNESEVVNRCSEIKEMMIRKMRKLSNEPEAKNFTERMKEIGFGIDKKPMFIF